MIKDTETIKVTILPTTGNRDTRLLARANISFETGELGVFDIKGYMLWRSDNHNNNLDAHVNVSPPSVRVRGKYVPIIFMDTEVWLHLEKAVFDAYLDKCGDNALSPSFMQDSIDLSDITL